jgi:hypothetical protein
LLRNGGNMSDDIPNFNVYAVTVLPANPVPSSVYHIRRFPGDNLRIVTISKTGEITENRSVPSQGSDGSVLSKEGDDDKYVDVKNVKTSLNLAAIYILAKNGDM